MKLGVVYSVFDGTEELLEKSILQIRPYCEFILVMYQTRSWFGKYAKKTDLDVVKSIKEKGLADMIFDMEYGTYTTMPGDAKLMELRKRLMGRDMCKNRGCTHLLSMDVDEFYMPEQFKNARQIIEDNNYLASSCKIKTYYKSPVDQVIDFEDIDVPFICDITLEYGKRPFITSVDSTRTVKIEKSEKTICFDPETIVMHHMAGVRKDLKFKYENTSRLKIDKRNIQGFINNKYNLPTITVDNYFDIKI